MKTLLNIVALLASFEALASPSDPVIEQYWLDNDMQSRFANTRVYDPSSSNQVIFNVGDLSEGGHAFHYRMATQDGNKVMWGRPVTKYFYIPSAKDKSNSKPTAYRLLLNNEVIAQDVIPDVSSFTLTPDFPEYFVLSSVSSRDFKYLLGEKKVSMTANGRISYSVQLMSDQNEWGAPLYKEIQEEITTKLEYDSIQVPGRYSFNKVDNNNFKAYRFRNNYSDYLYVEPSQDCQVSIYFVNESYSSNLGHSGSYELKKGETTRISTYSTGYDVIAIFYSTPTDKDNSAGNVDLNIMLEDHKVPQPEVRLDSDTWEVTMTCADPRATIWYTTDGSHPKVGEGSTVYTGPIVLDKFTRVRAYAVMEDWYGFEPSEEVDMQYGSAHLKIPTPELKFAGGLENNEFVLTNRVEGVTMYYTFGDNDLEDEGLRTLFDGTPFKIEDGARLKAFAEKENLSSSDALNRRVYLSDFVTAAPYRSNTTSEGEDYEWWSDRKEKMSLYVPEGTAYYRILDGKQTFDPTEEIDKTQWNEYKVDEYNDGWIVLPGGAYSGNKTVQAFAESEDKARSSVTDIYTDWISARSPKVDYNNYQLKLSTDVPGGVIKYHYGYSGNDSIYTQEKFPNGINVKDEWLVEAYVEAEGYQNSSTVRIERDSYNLSRPSIQYEDDGLLHIRHVDEDSNLQLVIEIKSPSNEYRAATYISSNHYTYDPLPNDTVRAYATKYGMNNSEVYERTPFWVPDIYVNDYNVYISWGYSGDIYYTLDGSLPTKSSTLYEGSFDVEKACTVRAVAYYPGEIPSEAEPKKVFDQTAQPVAKFNFSVQNTEEGPVEVKKILLDCPTPGAKIYYSLDRSLNDNSRKLYDPNDPENTAVDWAGLDVKDASYLYAYAEADDHRRSEEITVYISEGYLSMPNINVNEGVVEIWHDDPSVTIMPEITPAQEYEYVHEGETNKITFTPLYNTVVQAYVWKEGYMPSNVNRRDPLSKPEASVSDDYVYLYSYGGTVYYTTDGSQPTEASTPYEGGFYSEPCTIRFAAFADGEIPSEADPVRVLAKAAEPDIIFNYSVLKTEAGEMVKKKVKLSSSTPNTKIYYSLGRSITDSNRKLYYPNDPENTEVDEDGVTIGDQSYIYAYAEGDDYRRSETASRYLQEAYLNTPNISVNDGVVEIWHDDPTVTIKPEFTPTQDYTYVQDGTTNKVTCKVLYNTTVKASVEKNGYIPSSVNQLDPINKPVIQVNGYNVYIDTYGWNVYYTTDGTMPTELSIPYDGSFESKACTIRAAAFGSGWIPSEADPAKVMDQAAMPEIEIEGGYAKLSSSTPNATIYYTLDEGIGLGTRKVYDTTTLPNGIDISDVNVIRSYAEAQDYRQSETLVFNKDAYTLAAPVLSYSNGYVTADHDDDEVSIKFTDNEGKELQAEASDPRKVKVGYNTTVNAMAYRQGYVESRTVQVKHTDAPTITADLFKITIKGKSGQTLRYTTDGTQPTAASAEYTEPFYVTSSCKVRAVAFVDELIPSEGTAVDITYRKSQKPQAESYDGRYLTLKAEEGSSIRYIIGATGDPELGTVANGKIDVEGIQMVRAIAQRSDADDSDVFTFTPEYYANETDAYTSKPGVLEDAFGWISDRSSYTTLAVHGSLLGAETEDSGDYEFLRSFPNLRHLDLSNVTDEAVPSAAFDSKLISVALPSSLKTAGENVFGEENTTLCSVELPGNGFAPENLLDGVKNPNLLLYVKSTNLVSDLLAKVGDLVKNVVVLGTVNSTSRAESVTLTHADAFYAPKEFNAQKISFTRAFTKETQIGGFGSGWETMVVPFDVQTIACGAKTLKPFGEANTERGECPFWLFSAGETDWMTAYSLMANTPYLLAMPNNPLYADEFVVNGDVVFSSNNVTVPVTPDEEEMTYSFGTGKYIAGNYALIDKEESVLAINDETVNYHNTDFQPGGIFIANHKDVVPFECYVLNSGANGMPVFDQNAIDQLLEDYGTRIWGENYCIYVRSSISMKVRVYDSVGQLIRSVDVKAGETVQISDITPGIYFVGSTKILVKG